MLRYIGTSQCSTSAVEATMQLNLWRTENCGHQNSETTEPNDAKFDKSDYVGDTTQQHKIQSGRRSEASRRIGEVLVLRSFYRAMHCRSNPVCPSVCYVRVPWLNRLMFSENNIATNYPMNLAHCTTLLIDLTRGKHLQIWVKDEGVCTKMVFEIQNQRYLWNEAVWAKVTTECL